MGSSSLPRLHRHIIRWQYHVKAKIVRVVDKILLVVAVIVYVGRNLASEKAKICLSKSSFIIFGIFNGEIILFTKSAKIGLVSEINTLFFSSSREGGEV